MPVILPQEKSRKTVDMNFAYLDNILKQAEVGSNWETVCIEVNNVTRQLTIVGYSPSVEKPMIVNN